MLVLIVSSIDVYSNSRVVSNDTEYNSSGMVPLKVLLERQRYDNATNTPIEEGSFSVTLLSESNNSYNRSNFPISDGIDPLN